MMAIMAAVLAATGVVVLGWWIIAVITAAVRSRSQERVQRKARHWQAETARAPALADGLDDEADAHGGLPSGDDWPLLS